MKKILIITSILLLVLLLTVMAVNILTNPLRKSKETIKENILETTPLGTSMEDVIKTIKKNDEWKLEYVVDDYGYNDPETFDVIGEKYVRANIGSYFDGFTAHVVVFWGFDEESKLISIAVQKFWNGL